MAKITMQHTANNPKILTIFRQVAYEAGQLIDNGETIINRGGRVSPDFGGKGLIYRLSRYVYEWGLSQGAKGNVLAVSDGYPYLSNPSFKERSKYILTKVGTCAFTEKKKCLIVIPFHHCNLITILSCQYLYRS